jgi:hypothetical protein
MDNVAICQSRLDGDPGEGRPVRACHHFCDQIRRSAISCCKFFHRSHQTRRGPYRIEKRSRAVVQNSQQVKFGRDHRIPAHVLLVRARTCCGRDHREHVRRAWACQTGVQQTHIMPLTLDALGVTASLNREPKKLFRCRFLQGILYCLEGCELNGPGLAIQLFDFADIDVLHNVTRARINRDRSARTFPFHAPRGCDYRISVSLAAGLFQRLVDQTDTS